MLGRELNCVIEMTTRRVYVHPEIVKQSTTTTWQYKRASDGWKRGPRFLSYKRTTSKEKKNKKEKKNTDLERTGEENGGRYIEIKI